MFRIKKDDGVDLPKTVFSFSHYIFRGSKIVQFQPYEWREEWNMYKNLAIAFANEQTAVIAKHTPPTTTRKIRNCFLQKQSEKKNGNFTTQNGMKLTELFNANKTILIEFTKIAV